jgi:hypothetical protein
MRKSAIIIMPVVWDIVHKTHYVKPFFRLCRSVSGQALSGKFGKSLTLRIRETAVHLAAR